MWPFSPPRPRYLPERPLPPYAHLPGRTPHPTREPTGHSYGVPEVTPPRLDVAQPADSPDYLYGFDLLNHGYFWEAHTAWEGLWHAEGRQGPVAELLQALIRVASAGLKARQDVGGGVASHMSKAAILLRSVAEQTGQGRLAGIRLHDLARHCEGVAAAASPRGTHPDLDDGRWVWCLRPELP